MSGANEKHSSNPKLAEANVFEEDGQSRAARHTKNMQKTGNPRKVCCFIPKIGSVFARISCALIHLCLQSTRSKLKLPRRTLVRPWKMRSLWRVNNYQDY